MNSRLIKRTDQAVLAAVAAAVLVILAVDWLWRGGLSGGLVDIERAKPLGYSYTVDLNRAGWPELAQLPDIGEVLARRIVDRREKVGLYATVEDLLEVDGIGPRRLERVRSYLQPLNDGVLLGSD